MAGFTPGPWVFDDGSDSVIPGCQVKAPTPQGPGFPTPSATGFYVMACPPPHGRDTEAEQEANARLIAAAPEMFALLEECFDLLDKYADGDEDGPNQAMSLRGEIDRLLDRVEGRS